MLATIAMLLLLMGLTVSVSFNIMNLNQSNTDLQNSQRNIPFIDGWKAKIISNAKAVGENGEYVLPIGTNRSDYHTAPSWLSGTTYNPYGNELIYCPYGPIATGTLSQSIQLDATNSYNSRVLSNFATVIDGSARDYVVSSDAPHSSYDVLAFLISPLNHSNSLPKCTDISFDLGNNIYTVTNGIVREITTSEVEVYTQTKNLTKNELAYFENIIEGDSSATGNTLQNNIDYIINSNIPKAKLIIPSGTHVLTTTTFGNLSVNKKQEIIIEGSGRDLSIIDSDSTSTELTFNNANIHFKDIELNSKTLLTINKSKILIENSDVSNLSFNNSEADLDNIEILNSSLNNEPLYLYNSELKIKTNNSTINQSSTNNYAINSILSKIILEGVQLDIDNGGSTDIISLDNSKFINYGTLSITSTPTHISNIIIKEDSIFKNESGTVNVSGKSSSGIVVYGELIVDNSNIDSNHNNTTDLIVLNANSNLTIKNSSNIGNSITTNRPTTAIKDNGSRYISGDTNVEVYGDSNCWTGDIFTDSDAIPSNIGKNGSDSSTTNTTYRMFNRSNWNCTI